MMKETDKSKDQLISEVNALKNELQLANSILSTQQETSPDGIIVIDENDKIISYNRIFTSLWNIDITSFESKFYEVAINLMINKVLVPEQFDSWIIQMNANRTERGNMITILNNGKILDCYSAPMLGQDDKYYGKVWYFRDITEHKRIEMELGTLATLDGLTEVLNRKFGLLELNQRLQSIKKRKKTLCLCYLDINNFKEINDKYGHSEGDDVLKSVGNILKETLRDVDIIARIGGDEFLLGLPECTVKQANIVWDRITEKLQKLSSFQKKPYKLTLSRGFVQCDPDDKRSLDDVIAVADAEMYKDKQKNAKNGR